MENLWYGDFYSGQTSYILVDRSYMPVLRSTVEPQARYIANWWGGVTQASCQARCDALESCSAYQYSMSEEKCALYERSSGAPLQPQEDSISFLLADSKLRTPGKSCLL